MTLAVTLVVGVLLAVFGFFKIQGARDSQEQAIRDELEHLARSTQALLEVNTDWATFDSQTERTLERNLSRIWQPWVVEIVSGRELERLSAARPDLVESLVAERAPEVFDNTDDAMTMHVPIRVWPKTAAKYDVVGLISLTSTRERLGSRHSRDENGLIVSLFVILAIATLAIILVLAGQVLRPLRSLIDSIDAVARGDLSQVVFAEREDEFGQLAERFNAMTQSLRQSQQETARENDAKLMLEQRLRHSETMATVGQLAAEIAHEVGTPLNVISGRAKATARKRDRPDVVERNATIIGEQTDRITRIIERLLDLTRRRVGESPGPHADVNQVLVTSLELLEGQFSSSGITVTRRLASGPVHCKLDSDRLYQVILNVLVNAIHAAENGSVHVETARVTRRKGDLQNTPESEYVRITIRDTGQGIPAELHEKIFEPFYTTKGEAGTGLGLPVALAIVKDVDGWIDIEANPDGGTVFHIFLQLGSEDDEK